MPDVGRQGDGDDEVPAVRVGTESDLLALLGRTRGSAMKQAVVSLSICGPSRPGCVCRCPDTCEHRWDGAWLERRLPSGATEGQATCSRCGMGALDHDRWVLP